MMLYLFYNFKNNNEERGVFMGQKEIEQRCLDKALCQIAQRDKETRRILYKLQSVSESYQSNERPDFIARSYSANKIIGIEHFEVFEKSKKTLSGVGQSVTRLRRASAHEIYAKHKNSIQQRHHKDLKVHLKPFCKDMGKTMLQNINNELQSGYASLIASFSSAYNKHCDKVNSYYENLHKASQAGATIDLHFLIDIKWNLRDLCVYENGILQLHSGLWFGVFYDMIDIVLAGDPRVQYVIFVITDEEDDNNYQVFAFSRQSLQNKLNRRNVSFFDCLLLSDKRECNKVCAELDSTQENIKITASFDWDCKAQVEEIQQMGLSGCRHIKERKNFITDACYYDYLKLNLKKIIKSG